MIIGNRQRSQHSTQMMNKATHSRLVKLEQLAGDRQAAPILIVSELSEVPAGIDPRTLVICTGARRSLLEWSDEARHLEAAGDPKAPT